MLQPILDKSGFSFNANILKSKDYPYLLILYGLSV